MLLKENSLIENKYIVDRVIGKGGMSTVWLSHERESGKEWAIKEIYKSSDKYKAAQNSDGTLNEVEIVKKLNHPLIPHVEKVYNTSDTILIIMEYVDGISLRKYLEENGPLSEKEVVSFMKSICEIFIYLHTRENPIIYRDLKPANVMINRDGKLKLIDFGIAVEISEDETSDTGPLGTKGFASPEHFEGHVDERSDIYTLGMTFYNLLTGRNPLARDFKMVPITEIDPTFSKGLERIILKATEKDPKLRYQSISEFLKDLMTYDKKQEGKKKYFIAIIALIIALLASIFFLFGPEKDKSPNSQDYGIGQLEEIK